MMRLLWKTVLAMAIALERVMLEEFLNCPPGPNHAVSTISPLFTVAGRVTVQNRVTILSLIKRPVFVDTSTLGGGTKHKITAKC